MDITYKIRHIKDDQDKDLSYLLKLYIENTDPCIKTNPNEIIYWLNNFEKRKGNDTFWILALYMNNKPIGFCQMIYFNNLKIVFVDYCVIDPEYRGRAFSEYTYLIRDFFSEKSIDLNYFVTEIAFYSYNNIPSQTALKLIRLLKMSGMKVIKAPYTQPELGLENHESKMNATLMIWINGKGINQVSLKKETYIEIVQAIFYNHYITWYDAFMTYNEMSIYRKNIDNIYESIKKEINKEDSILLNGEPYMFEPSNTAPPNNLNKKTILIFIISLIFIYIAISGLGFLLEDKFNIPPEAQFNNWKIAGVFTMIVLIIWVTKSKDLRILLYEWIQNFIKSR
jgi:hypothetical protein